MQLLIIFVLALILTNISASELRHIEFEKRNNSIAAVVAEDGRITNGQSATEGQFPYQVLLTMNRYYCGGSLIGQNWVLTAAHCTAKANSVVVYLGAIKRYSSEISYTVNKRDIIIHEGYSRRFLRNDISLIKIPTVTFSDRIQPVKLPALSSSYDLYTGYKAIASGWGRTANSGRPDNLQWATMEIISNDVCARTFGFILISSHICVSTTGGISTCNGDSGGPLVLESSNIQVGLTSFGSATSCVKGKPAAFTRVTSFLDWIKSHTGISY